MLLQKNKIYRAAFTGYTAEGAAVAHINGMTVFVPGGAAGDQCDVKIVKVTKRLAYGRIERIVVRSKHRVEPACHHAGRCGGCCYQHLTYEEELRAKQTKVTDALSRIGGLSVPCEITGAEQITGYRNKAQFPVGEDENGPYTGFYQPRSHHIVRVENCQITHPVANQIAQIVCSWMQAHHVPAYQEHDHTGLIRHIYVRTGAASGETHLCLVATRNKLPEQADLIDRLTKAVPSLTGIVLNLNKRTDNVILGDHTRTLWGTDALEDSLCGNLYRISPQAFYQVNHAQTERLYDSVRTFAQLTGRETVLDLYCGVGTIALTLASHAAQVIGVEIVPEAVNNARENAERNGIQNAQFLCADAGQAALMLAERGEQPDVLTVDPPRKGLSAETISAILQMAPVRVVYVSCDPATLARDCKALCAEGYQVVRAQAFDLFPRTSHVETVVLLSKLNAKQHIEVELNLDELDLTAAESKATYDEIKAYVLEKYGLKVSSLYISQVKRKCGLDVGQNYNLSKKEDTKVPQCPPEKEAAIMDALKHFQMLE